MKDVGVLMWRIWVIVLVCFGYALPCLANSVDYTSFDRVLKRVVDANGHVDYQALKKDSDLKFFVNYLANVSPKTHPELFPAKADSLAFWINAYNACVLYGISRVYPIASVQEIAPDFGFFKQEQFVVGGQSLSLDYIEHKIIRENLGDPRIHAAINCAAISCPRLQNYVFHPNTLDGQLQSVMQAMIQDKQHVFIDRTKKIVYLSSIFDWFAVDFQTGELEGDVALLAYVSAFLPPDDQEFLQQQATVDVQFLTYDWTLNDQKQ